MIIASLFTVKYCGSGMKKKMSSSSITDQIAIDRMVIEGDRWLCAWCKRFVPTLLVLALEL